MTDINKIIKKSRSGDQKSQRKLYELFRKKWYIICLRYGKNKTDAEDIFQEGLIQIFTSLNTYDNAKSKFLTWSSRVMIHSAIRYLKKTGWKQLIGELDESVQYVREGQTILERLETKELITLIQQLPMGYRIVFNMYAIEGYSHREIAGELGISEGTSKSQLYKARRQLKDKLHSYLNSSQYG